jgi:hypothetical protein
MLGYIDVQRCIYSMLMLSIRGKILSHTEHPRKRFHRTLSIRRTNFRVCSANGKMLTVFTFTAFLSIRGNDFIAPWAYDDLNAGWAYEGMISSLTEHTRKCLKVEYLDRIEYDFQKFRVTGPWDHKDSVSAKKYKKIKKKYQHRNALKAP